MKPILVCNLYDGLEIYRGEKILYGKFLAPHRVISTCRLNGGLREDLLFVANHQACEPKPCPGKEHGRCLAVRKPERYHHLVCEYHGLPPKKTALLGTAANMTLAGWAEESFDIPNTEEVLKVMAVVTAGVETNAGRAGDPAQVYEWEGHFSKFLPPGTINILLFINQELAPCALVRAVKMATEAKTAALQELNVPSRYSCGLATGTGTDQIAIASLLTGRIPLRGVGKHVKLGELVARAVKRALKEGLSRQNQLTPETLRYVPRLLGRFGLTEEIFFEALKPYLSREHHLWLFKNRKVVLSDTKLVAAVLSYIHLWDQYLWGVLPPEIIQEALLEQAVLIAIALSGKTSSFEDFRAYLARFQGFEPLLLAAIALGFSEKWNVTYFHFLS